MEYTAPDLLEATWALIADIQQAQIDIAFAECEELEALDEFGIEDAPDIEIDLFDDKTVITRRRWDTA